MAPPLSTLERGGRLGKDPPPLLSLPWAKKIPLLFFLVKEGKRVGGNKMCLCCPRPFSGCGGGGGGGGGFFTLTIFAQIIPGENPRVFALPVCLGGFFFGKICSSNFYDFPPNRIHACIPGSFFCKGVKKRKRKRKRGRKKKRIEKRKIISRKCTRKKKSTNDAWQ